MKRFFRRSLSSRRRLKMFRPYSTGLKKFPERSTPSLLWVFPRGVGKMATARLTKFYPERALPTFAGKRIWAWDGVGRRLRTPEACRGLPAPPSGVRVLIVYSFPGVRKKTLTPG